MIKELTYPLPWNDNWVIVDPSKLVEFMECPRKYFYRHVIGWASTAPNNHLVFGSSWHKGQEHMLLNGYDKVDEAILLFMEEYRKDFPPDSDVMYSPKTPTNADRNMRQYASYYQRDLDEFEVLYTEIAGSVLITENFELHFRMDSILRELTGEKKYFSLDHKTGSRKGRTWTDKWLLATAIGTYNHVLYCLFPEEEVKGIQIRGTFFYKGEKASEEIFQDVPCWKSKGQMRSWLWSTVYWCESLKTNYELFALCSESDEVMMAFPMQTESCTKYFGCPYHDFCSAWHNPLQRCEEPPMGFEVKFWNPMDDESTHKMEGLK